MEFEDSEDSPESSRGELDRGDGLEDAEVAKNKYTRLGKREKVKMPYYKGMYSRRQENEETTQALLDSQRKSSFQHSPKHFRKKIAKMNKNIVGLK